MIHSFHPEAAAEYAEHVAFYKSLRRELGQRFHKSVKTTMVNICERPFSYRIEYQPDIRYVKVAGFSYHIIFRVIDDAVQVLAIAHYRRRPLYWLNRL